MIHDPDAPIQTDHTAILEGEFIAEYLGRSGHSTQSLHDLPELTLDRVRHFFEHYKDLEKGKWVKIEGWRGPDEARREILASVARYQEAPVKPNY